MAVAVLGHSRHRTRQIPHRGWMPPGAPSFASITPPNKRGNPEGASRVWRDARMALSSRLVLDCRAFCGSAINSRGSHAEFGMSRRDLMRRAVVMVFVLSLALGGFGGVARAQSFDIIKVADGVYGANGKSGVYSNGAFIVNKDDVVVVDTHLRPSWARDLIAEIKKVTDKPVRYVVDTHWHPDHVQGNQSYVSAFGPNVEYLAQHNTRDDMIHKGIPSVQESLTKDVPEAIKQLEQAIATGNGPDGKPLTDQQKAGLPATLASQKAYLEELKQIRIVLPTITFDRSLILHKPDRDVHVYFLGKGHTRGDVVVYLPKEKEVMTGDLLTDRKSTRLNSSH